MRSREQASNTSIQAAGQVARFIEGIRYLLLAIAENDAVRYNDPLRANRYLSILMKQFDHLANFGIIDANGNVRASGIPLKGPVNLSGRLYFRKAMDERRFVCGEYQVGKITGQATINFGYPIMFDANTPVGVAFAALKLEHIDAIFSNIILPEGGEIVVLDNKGKVLYSRLKDYHKIGEPFPDKILIDSLKEDSVPIHLSMGKDEVKRIYAHCSIPNVEGLHVLVGLSEKTALADANRALARNLILIVIVFLVAMAFAWGLGNVFILRRIRALISAADRIAGGDFNARTGILHDEGELGHLAGSFDSMARSLQASDAQIRESEERYRTIVQNTHEGILIIDDKQRIIFANDQIMMITGYDAHERLGMNFTDFFDDSCKAEIIARYNKRLRGEPVPPIYEAVILRKDGTKRNVEVRVSAILTGEGEKNFIVQLLDITERKIAEQEKIKLEQQMLQTQKLESLGVLAGGIAHDFNNILMAIMGHADLAMLDLPDTAPAKESLHEIILASRRAADLSRQMLAYAGRALFVVENIHLNKLIEEMAFLLRTSISKKATLNLNLSKDDLIIRGDATQMRQIIMNLITNASEAIEDRNGEIRITTREIDCDAAFLSEFTLGNELLEGRYVMLEVSDTGKGMDQQTRNRIFEPFFTTKFAGRGLGLAAVLGIVRGHKGALKVYSEPGKGTNFKILIPTGEIHGAINKTSPLQTKGTRTEGRRYGSILLVDDEEAVRSLGKMMLEKLGYNAVISSDGREAVTIFEKLKNTIICVILDLTMPAMDGYETFKELRRIRDDIPIILSSGYTQHDVLQRFADSGLSGFIQKPYTLENLNMELRRVLDSIDDSEEKNRSD